MKFVGRISGLVVLAFVSSGWAAPRQSVVTIFDAVHFVDGATPQSAQAVVQTGKSGHVTMVSQLADVTNPNLSGISVTCTFVMTNTSNPATTLAVVGFTGTISRDGFIYPTERPGTAVLGPYLVCRTAPISGNVASTLTLKAVFTK